MTDCRTNLPSIIGALARVVKLLLRIFFFSLFLIFLLLAILHIPATQKRIASEISEYLSTETGGEIIIKELKFSILGSVDIGGLEVIDPLNEIVLSANSISVEFNTSDLLFGDMIFRHVQVRGLNSLIIQDKEVLNIQFIIDAFKTDKSTQQTNSENPVETTIQFKEIDLQDIQFKFLSLDENIDFQTSIGSLHIEGTDLNINPNKLNVDRLSLENTHSYLVTSRIKEEDPIVPDLVVSNQLPFLDFNTGFDFNIAALEIMENSFLFHVNKNLEKQHFDPQHIDASSINIRLIDLVVRKDSLSAEIMQVAAELPGFSLVEFQSSLNADLNQLHLSIPNLLTENSNFEMEVNGQFNHFPDLLHELDQAGFQVSISGHIDKDDLGYFIADSFTNQIHSWPAMQIEADTRYASGKADIESFDFGVGDSRLSLEGVLANIKPDQNITWENLIINSTIGKEFREFLLPFTTGVILPPGIRIKLNTSGKSEKFDLAGQVLTSWGTVNTWGTFGVGEKELNMDLTLEGEKVHFGKIFNLSWLGSTDLSLKTKGQIGDDFEMDIEGSIGKIDLFDNTIFNMDISSRILNDTATAVIIIEDPNFGSRIDANLSFNETLSISGNLLLDEFRIGKLFHQDTSFEISGDLNTKIRLDSLSTQGFLQGRNVAMETASIKHQIDSLTFNLVSVPDFSSIEFYTDNINGTSETNFQIEEVVGLFQTLQRDYLFPSDNPDRPKGNRNMTFDFKLSDATLLQLMGLDIMDFQELTFSGQFIEKKQVLDFNAATQNFSGYGISLDTMDVQLAAITDSLNSSISIQSLYYDSTYLGDLELGVFNSDKIYYSDLLLSRDSVYLAAIKSRLSKSVDDFYLFLDSLVVFNYTYNVDANNPIIINENNVRVDQFMIGRDEVEIFLDGNLTNFDIEAKNLDLLRFNAITADSMINSGVMNSSFAYSKAEKQVNLNLDVDSLTIYDYPPMYIHGKANNQGQAIPFQFSLNSTTNNIDLGGNYNFDNSGIAGSLLLDINDLEVFEILAPNFMDKMAGKIKGEATIEGSIKEPELSGFLRLQDIRLTTTNPKAVLNIQDEIINLDQSGITFMDFTLYDQAHSPLTVNGYIKTSDYKSFTYDLDVNTDKYILINSPQVNERQLQGILVIGSDIKLTGSNVDTFISADVIIRDSTHLAYFTDSEDIELISSEGIVEFVNLNQLQDSVIVFDTQFYNDSLIAILPQFEMKASIKLDENAIFRINLDPRSGNFIQASGNANLQVYLDKTGTTRLTGNYTIKDGSYQLSFYDVVNKKFTIAPGSNIVWEGDPNTGNLNVRALHMIKTSSSGLIGHEVSENEKAQYRRALEYEVGIIIAGSIDNPNISFALDLSQEDKTNFPALANKLNRLKQPEFESELNKQVFGLLVLGGFIPETSGSEFDQSLVATTAISNSVNSILASQLNRFASQYIKAVDINVGLQSYSDFIAGSGQTRTAMEVRVSKQMMDDRLNFEIGGGMDISTNQSGPNTGSDNFRGDIAIIYDLTESGNKQIKVFNNETYDIIYHRVRNTGISLIFIREFNREKLGKK